jgi:hypothetical protein
VEIIDRPGDAGAEIVPIAYADTREEAALIRGLLREMKIRSIARQAGAAGGAGASSLLTSSPRHIYVRPEDAAAARELIAETMVEEPAEEIPEPVNAIYLDEAAGHRPRSYTVFGAYARAYLIAGTVFAVLLLVFLLLH